MDNIAAILLVLGRNKMSAILIGQSKPVNIGRAESVAVNTARDIRSGKQYDAGLTTAASVALASGFASTLASSLRADFQVTQVPARYLLSVVAAIDKTMGAGGDSHSAIFCAKEGRRHVARLIERGIK